MFLRGIDYGFHFQFGDLNFKFRNYLSNHLFRSGWHKIPSAPKDFSWSIFPKNHFVNNRMQGRPASRFSGIMVGCLLINDDVILNKAPSGSSIKYICCCVLNRIDSKQQPCLNFVFSLQRGDNHTFLLYHGFLYFLQTVAQQRAKAHQITNGITIHREQFQRSCLFRAAGIDFIVGQNFRGCCKKWRCSFPSNQFKP